MHKRLVLKTMSVLIAMVLLLTMNPMSVGATSGEDIHEVAAVVPQPAFDYVTWGGSISSTTTSGYVLVGQTRSLANMGLYPEACSNGLCTRDFIWTSGAPSIAAVDPGTGAITGVSTGTTVITGTSSFGVAHGQLVLVVFVSDGLKGATFMGINGQFDKCSNNHYFKYSVVLGDFHSMGYTPYVLRTTATASEFVAYVATSRMLCFRNHGNQTSLLINNTELNFVYTDYILNLPIDSFEYCELAVIASERSGNGGVGATNIVNALHSRGVGTVVGITSSITCDEMDHWIEGVFTYLYDGYSVQEACEMTAADFKDWDDYLWGGHYKHICTNDCTSRCTGYHMENYYIAGNANATFN